MWGEISRSFTSEVEIRRSGDGRTVAGYAAIFDTETEIDDQHGRYRERIDRSAFNRAVARGTKGLMALYNHGYSLDGERLAELQIPVGQVLTVRPDGRGLYTETRLGTSPVAENLRAAIEDGTVAGMSFRGRVHKSDPMKVPRIQRGGPLPLVTRTELGLSEISYTPQPFYAGAGVVALRSQGPRVQPFRHARQYLPETAEEILRSVAAGYDLDPQSAHDLAVIRARLDGALDEVEPEMQIVRARLVEIDSGEEYGDEAEVDELIELYDELDAAMTQIVADYIEA